MYKMLIPVVFIALVLVSCSSSTGMGNANVTQPTASSFASAVMTILPSEPAASSDTMPNLVFKENDGKVTITESKYGFSMVIPSEYKQIMSYTGVGGEVKFQLHFDFTKAPYNGLHTEDCSSFISVNLEKDEFKYNSHNDNRPRTVIENPNGHNILIIDKSQTVQGSV